MVNGSSIAAVALTAKLFDSLFFLYLHVVRKVGKITMVRNTCIINTYLAQYDAISVNSTNNVTSDYVLHTLLV